MRAYDKKKRDRLAWATQRKAGLINNAADGGWRKPGAMAGDPAMSAMGTNGASHRKVL